MSKSFSMWLWMILCLLVNQGVVIAEPQILVDFQCSVANGGEFVLAYELSGFPEQSVDLFLFPETVYLDTAGGNGGLTSIGGFIGSPFQHSPFTLPPGVHRIVAYVNDPLGEPSSEFLVPDSCTLPFAQFLVKKAQVTLKQEFDKDSFKVIGIFQFDTTGDGIDIANEDVFVEFNEFRVRFPAGAFFKEGKKYVFESLPGFPKVTIIIRDNGRFRIKANQQQLENFDMNSPILFSLQIGDDKGETNIQFNSEGHFDDR